MYALDPEGNTIEIYCKTGLPVPQPHSEAVDLELSDEELYSLAEAAVPEDSSG